MWVMTRSDWPVLVNLARTRIVASAWEQEFTLAECADGDQARALVSLISQALADGENLLDLRGVNSAQLAATSDTVGQ